MQVVRAVFQFLASVASIYSLLCVVRVFLTWVPELESSKFGLILAQICDPFLDVFRRITILRFANFDFSPVLAFVALSLFSTLCTQIASYGAFRLGVILASLVHMVWSLVSSVITLFSIISAIRLIMDVLNRPGNSLLWDGIDRAIYQVASRVLSVFSPRRAFTYRTALIVTLVASILAQVLGSLVFGWIATLFARLPL